MDNELISVIIPVYNTGKYIDRCLESVCNQTYRKLEIIIVDDGSIDDSGTKIDQWAKNDSRIKVLHKENRGVADARNQGLKMSEGGYIAWVDSDDWIEKTYLENLYDALTRSKADVAISYYGRKINGMKQYTGKKILKAFFLMELSNMLWPTLIKKEFYQDEMFRDYKIGEDTDMLGRIFEKVNKVVVYQDCGYHYEMSDNSAVHRCDYEKYMSWLDLSIDQVAYFRGKYVWLRNYVNYRALYISSLIYHTIVCEDNTVQKKILVKKLKKEIKGVLLHLPWRHLRILQMKEVASAVKILLGG